MNLACLSLEIQHQFVFCSRNSSQLTLLDQRCDFEQQQVKLITANIFKPSDFVMLQIVPPTLKNNVTVCYRTITDELDENGISTFTKIFPTHKFNCFHSKNGFCDVSENPYEELLDKLVCHGNHCETEPHPTYHKGKGRIKCIVDILLIDQKNGFLDHPNFDSCYAPEICDDNCECKLDEKIITWNRIMPDKIQSNYYIPIGIYKDMQIINNGIYNNKTLFYKIVNVTSGSIYNVRYETLNRNKISNSDDLVVKSKLKEILQDSDQNVQNHMYPIEHRDEVKRMKRDNNDYDFVIYVTKENFLFTNHPTIVSNSISLRQTFIKSYPNKTLYSKNIISPLINDERKHKGHSESCTAWLRSLDIFRYLDNEFVMKPDFLGIPIYLYISQRQIWLPKCYQTIESVQIVKSENIQENGKDFCHIDLPIVYTSNNKKYKGYMNMHNIVSASSKITNCKNINQLYILMSNVEFVKAIKIQKFFTVLRSGKNLTINIDNPILQNTISINDFTRHPLNFNYEPKNMEEVEYNNLEEVVIFKNNDHVLNVNFTEKINEKHLENNLFIIILVAMLTNLCLLIIIMCIKKFLDYRQVQKYLMMRSERGKLFKLD